MPRIHLSASLCAGANIVVDLEEPRSLKPTIGWPASGAMQDRGYGLLRILLPRTSGNKRMKEQLSWMSRGKVVRRPPRGAVFEDGVEDREQLAHAGYQSHLLRFAGRQKTLVEFLHYRVAARGDQGAHV